MFITAGPITNGSPVCVECLLYFLLLLAVSNYGSGSHIYLFWQKSPVKLITNGSRPALRGDPSTFFGVFVTVTPQF